MASGNIPTKEEVEPTMSQIKSAYLKNEFKISKSALYDYYSTNSGIFARNPTIDGQGGGGGGDPSELEERVEELEDTTSTHTRQMSIISNDVEEISSDISGVVTMKRNMTTAAQSGLGTLSTFVVSSDPEYNEIDDIISDQDILKKVQENFLSAVISGC